MKKSELREKRKRLGITQAVFAKHLGVSFDTYKSWELESGNNINNAMENLINLTIQKIETIL